MPICEPWCWNMHTNIYPCPKSPSFVGEYTSTMVRIWDIYIYIYHWDTDIQTVQKREMERNKDIIGIYNDIYIYMIYQL